MSALSGRGISIRRQGRALLDSVDVNVSSGGVTAIIGPNGAGKSTLLAVLAGDIPPDEGTVLLGDDPLQRIPVSELARRRSVLLQNSAVAFSYSVREVVTMGRSAWRMTDADEEHSIVENALARTDTLHLAGRDVTTLSGGEQARASLARVLAQTAPIVLLDEPTAALDIAHQEEVLGLAGSLAAAGGAVVLVLHDLDAAATHADHVVVLADGRVVASGAPSAVMTGEILSEVYRHRIDVIEHPITGRPLIAPARRRFLAE